MARLDISPGLVLVSISRRNLLALLHMLDVAGGSRAIANYDCYRDGKRIDDTTLILRPEEDELHYARRKEPPGPMRPDAEEAITRYYSRRRPQDQPGEPSSRAGSKS